ncbi:hypothetical protein F5Y09DRAFT_356969 [Xylaria sp. FL1042]|nr:hypothetical protein F5Y09DRAFT_356969 [Xylaria sp. FL1042]
MSVSPSSFHSFRNLPLELRLMIWEEFANLPRIIHLFHVPGDSHVMRVLTIGDQVFVDVPVLFFVNSESRRVAKRLYSTIKVGVTVGPLFTSTFALNFALGLHIRFGDEIMFHDVRPSFRAVPGVCAITFQQKRPCELDAKKILRWIESLPTTCVSTERKGAAQYAIRPHTIIACSATIIQKPDSPRKSYGYKPPPLFDFDDTEFEKGWVNERIDSNNKKLGKVDSWILRV